LQLAKLELAQRQLEQTSLPLDEIAERCGFAAERSLRRTWSRWKPHTPGEYRRTTHTNTQPIPLNSCSNVIHEQKHEQKD